MLDHLVGAVRAYCVASAHGSVIPRASDHIMLFQGTCIATAAKPLDKMRDPARAEALHLHAWKDAAHMPLSARIGHAIAQVKTLQVEFQNHPCLEFSNSLQARLGVPAM